VSRHLPALLFLIPFAAALLCVVLGERRRRAAAGVAGGAMLLAAAMAVTALVAVLRDGTIRMHMGGWAPPLGIEWVLDPLAALMALLVGGVGATVLVGARAAIGRELEGRQSLFYASALLLVSGLMGMALTGDLFNMFVFLELGSLSAYALVATGPRRAPGAAMRYLLIGSLGASLYLLGVGFIYATTGTLNMADVAARLPAADPRPALTGLALIIAGLGVKMGLVPLHGWMPAAYSRGPAAASALLAPLATKLAGYALIRVLFWACPLAFLREHKALLH
jgi:multicomponent Na+:H+ antiporter subunit D